jgi:hypothetical protein
VRAFEQAELQQGARFVQDLSLESQRSNVLVGHDAPPPVQLLPEIHIGGFEKS